MPPWTLRRGPPVRARTPRPRRREGAHPVVRRRGAGPPRGERVLSCVGKMKGTHPEERVFLTLLQGVFGGSQGV